MRRKQIEEKKNKKKKKKEEPDGPTGFVTITTR